MTVKLANLGGDADYSCTRASGKLDIEDHYQATLRQFARNRDAQTRTKDFYALWRSAMAGLRPNPGELKVVYEARANRLSADVRAASERLELEKAPGKTQSTKSDAVEKKVNQPGRLAECSARAGDLKGDERRAFVGSCLRE